MMRKLYNYTSQQEIDIYDQTNITSWAHFVPTGLPRNLFYAYVADGMPELQAAKIVLHATLGRSQTWSNQP